MMTKKKAMVVNQRKNCYKGYGMMLILMVIPIL